MDVHDTLRMARQRAGLSLRDLADAAGTSHSTLAAYEQRRKVPRVDTAQRILRAAGTATDLHAVPRPGRRDPAATARALVDVLALADAFPFTREGDLDAPVFGRVRSDAA